MRPTRRDQMLQLHAMASTVLNGAGMSSSSGRTLPDAASDLIDDVREIVSVLRRAADRVILPLHNRTRSMRWLTRSQSGRRAVDVA